MGRPSDGIMIQILLTWLLLPLLWLGRRHAPGGPRRILVIQIAKIGDVVCTTPLLRELRAALPQAHIAVLAVGTTAPLLRHNPHVDTIMIAEPRAGHGLAAKLRLAAQLRRGNFDTVLCCNGGAVWPAVTLWAGIGRRIGVIPNFGGSTLALAQGLWSVGVAHHGDRMIVATYFDMLRALGLAPTNADKEVYPAPGAAAKASALLPVGDGQVIGLAVSAANKLKELGTEKQAALVEQLLVAWPAARILLLGGPDDARQARMLLAALAETSRSRIVDTCGALDLADLPALLAGLDLFVGVDSGLTYMADALKVPLVSVAGPCNMRETGPVGPRARIIQKVMPCLPCAHIFHAPYSCRIGTRACITEVQSGEIVDVARHLLKDDQT